MSDKDGDERSKKGRGTLRDDAANSSGRSAGKRSWNSVIRRATDNVPSASEESSGNISQAVEAHAEEIATQKEISHLSGLIPLREFLAPQKGDNDVVWKDFDGSERTGLQIRVFERITELSKIRRELEIEEGAEGSTVRTIDDELLNLNALLPRGEGSMLDASSALFDLEQLEKKRGRSEPPEPRADEIGPELENEGIEIPGEVEVGESGVDIEVPLEHDSWDGLSGLHEASTGESVDAPKSLGNGGEEGAGLSETHVLNASGEKGVEAIIEDAEAQRGDEDLWFQNEGGEVGTLSEIPARPSMIEGVIPILDGVDISPIGPEEVDLVAGIDELDYVALQEMALTRRMSIEQGKETDGKTDVEAIGELLAQAKALEAESDRRNPNNVQEAVPSGTVIRTNEKAEPTGPVGAGVSRKKEGKTGTETVMGVLPVKPVSKPVSSRTVIKRGGAAQETDKPVGAGLPKATEPGTREKTVLGMQGVEGDGTKGDSELSQSGLFGDLDDTGMKEVADEGSRADIVVPIIETDKVKVNSERSERMDTGAMRRGDEGVGNVASLEGTSIRLPQANKPERTEETRRDIELAKTRLSALPPEKMDVATTAVITPLEDFSRYGDIFYAMETVFMESGGRLDVGLDNFAGHLDSAIMIADAIAAQEYTTYESGASPEMRRVQRLKAFKKEFVDVPTGKENPRKDIKQYMLWHEKQKSSYTKIADVFDILEISPGEYSRMGMLRICDVYLESKELDADESKKVQALKLILEAKKSEGEVDEFAAERIAELNYEMVVGFGTRGERELRKNQVEGILKMEAELRELKLTVSAFEQKEDQMVSILSSLYASMKKADGKQAGMAKYVPEIRMALMELEPDYREREKYMKALFRAIKGEGEIGTWLGKRAKDKIDRGMRVAEKASAEQARDSRKGTGATKAIGIVGLPLVGAAILAGGLWLGQHGITLPFGKNVIDTQEDAAAEVTAGETDTNPPAGVAGEVDANFEEETKVSKPNAEPKKEPKEKVKVPEPEEPKVKPKPESKEEATEKPTEKKEYVGPETEHKSREYRRNKKGLSKALDDWCASNRGTGYHVVSKEMLRGVYGMLEEKLNPKVNPYSTKWKKKMLKKLATMKGDPFIKAVLASDLLRRSDLTNEERWVASAISKIALAERTKIKSKRFVEYVERYNKKGASLPELDPTSALGKIDYDFDPDTRRQEISPDYNARCMASSVGRRAGTFMEVALENDGRSKKKFFKGLGEWLGRTRTAKLRKQLAKASWVINAVANEESCRALTKGEEGIGAAERVDQVGNRWEENYKKNAPKRKKKKEEEKLIDGAFKDKKKLKEVKKKGDTLKKKRKKGKKKDDSNRAENKKEMDNLEYIEQQYEKQSKQAAQKTRDALFSYRGGIGVGKSDEAKRLAKKEAYNERFRVRMGVEEKKPSPFKKLASKLRMNKGFGRAVARA